jgi:hypothetical protein
MKQVAILLASAVVLGLLVWVCFFPPPKLPDHALGDEKCDICGEPVVYRLWMERRYLVGEYCRAHRWFGMVHAAPTDTVTKILLGAALFGIVYSTTSLLGRSGQRTPDSGHEIDAHTPEP